MISVRYYMRFLHGRLWGKMSRSGESRSKRGFEDWENDSCKPLEESSYMVSMIRCIVVHKRSQTPSMFHSSQGPVLVAPPLQ